MAGLDEKSESGGEESEHEPVTDPPPPPPFGMPPPVVPPFAAPPTPVSCPPSPAVSMRSGKGKEKAYATVCMGEFGRIAVYTTGKYTRFQATCKKHADCKLTRWLGPLSNGRPVGLMAAWLRLNHPVDGLDLGDNAEHNNVFTLATLSDIMKRQTARDEIKLLPGGLDVISKELRKPGESEEPPDIT